MDRFAHSKENQPPTDMRRVHSHDKIYKAPLLLACGRGEPGNDAYILYGILVHSGNVSTDFLGGQKDPIFSLVPRSPPPKFYLIAVTRLISGGADNSDSFFSPWLLAPTYTLFCPSNQ